MSRRIILTQIFFFHYRATRHFASSRLRWQSISGRDFLCFRFAQLAKCTLRHTIAPHPMHRTRRFFFFCQKSSRIGTIRHHVATFSSALDCSGHARARRKYRGKSARWRHGESARSLTSFDFALLLSFSSISRSPFLPLFPSPAYPTVID